MHPKCERSSASEATLSRRRAVLTLFPAFAGAVRVTCFAFAVGALSRCAATQAEVGSDPRLDAGSIVADGASRPADASADGSDAGSARCDPLAPLRLYYWNLRTASSSTAINYIVKVENATGAAIALSSLEVRYYFTSELAPPTNIDVFYTDTCCSNKMTDFKDGVLTSVPAWPAKPNANAYLQIAFATAVGSLAAGDAVQVELAFHDVGYVRSLTQSNDYSFGAMAGGTQTQWDSCPGPQCESKFTSCAITVHKDGLLVWGSPP